MKRYTSLSCLSIPAVTHTNKRSGIIQNKTEAIFGSKINYFLEIETIRLQVMLTRKSKICCSVDKKGACAYMCYIWFCSVINFVWKKCKKFNVIQEKVKMANWIFDRALLLYRSSNRIQHSNVALVLLSLLLCINHCHGKNYRFLFWGKICNA